MGSELNEHFHAEIRASKEIEGVPTPVSKRLVKDKHLQRILLLLIHSEGENPTWECAWQINKLALCYDFVVLGAAALHNEIQELQQLVSGVLAALLDLPEVPERIRWIIGMHTSIGGGGVRQIQLRALILGSTSPMREYAKQRCWWKTDWSDWTEETE